MEEELKKLTLDVVLGGILMNGYFDVAQDQILLQYFKKLKFKVRWIRLGLIAQ
jgi:L-proline amide hydrolase